MKWAGDDILERALDLAAYRQKLISGNMANVDTPGYRTRDIDFRQELARQLQSGEMLTPEAQEVPNLLERPDGNNVSIERESLAMAETQLQFREASQLLRREFRLIRLAIGQGQP